MQFDLIHFPILTSTFYVLFKNFSLPHGHEDV